MGKIHDPGIAFDRMHDPKYFVYTASGAVFVFYPQYYRFQCFNQLVCVIYERFQPASGLVIADNGFSPPLLPVPFNRTWLGRTLYFHYMFLLVFCFFFPYSFIKKRFNL